MGFDLSIRQKLVSSGCCDWRGGVRVFSKREDEEGPRDVPLPVVRDGCIHEDDDVSEGMRRRQWENIAHTGSAFQARPESSYCHAWLDLPDASLRVGGLSVKSRTDGHGKKQNWHIRSYVLR